MEVQIHKCNTSIIKVTISCIEVNSSVERLKRYIEMFDEKLRGKYEKEIYYVNITDILYFETVDNRTFLYTESKVMEVEQKIYELVDMLDNNDFFKNSKSQIVNINKISKIRPEINRTIMATMCNGEIIHISRKYAKDFKNKIGI